jgi:hypothetical protein
MDALSIPGPPCPLCGQGAFAWQTPDDLTIEIGDARYRPRRCAECGNIQLVLTRVEALDETFAAP